MAASLRHQLWIVLAASIVFFTNLGATHLWDDDETIYASIARDMLHRGDWVVPMFNGAVFAEKPPLTFWSIMNGFQLFGVTEFGARFWAAVCGVATAVVTYHLGRLLFNARVGLWGGLVMASTIIFTVSARAATIDAALGLLTTLAMLAFVRGGLSKNKSRENLPKFGAGLPTAPKPSITALADLVRPSIRSVSRPENGHNDFGGLDPALLLRRPWWSDVLFYACLGGAVLAKGPVGLLLPAATIGLFLLIANRWTASESLPESPAPGHRYGLWNSLRACGATLASWFAPANMLRSVWQMRPLAALLVVLLVAAPWYILVDVRTDGDWLRGFLAEFNLRPFVQPSLGHWGPIWYYIPAILIGFFPWSLFVIETATVVFRRVRDRRPGMAGDVLMLCWLATHVGFWSICSTKLPHYMVPVYPALALLTACWIDHWLAAPAVVGRRASQRVAVVLVIVGLGMAVALPIVSRFCMPGESILGLLGLSLIAGGGACWFFARRDDVPRFLTTFTATAVVFLTSVFGFAAQRIDRHQNAPAMAAAIAADSSGPRQIAAYGFFRQSMAYYTQQPVPDCDNLIELGNFLDQAPRPYIFTTPECAAEIESRLRGPWRVIARQPRFLKSGDLLVVSRPADGHWRAIVPAVDPAAGAFRPIPQFSAYRPPW